MTFEELAAAHRELKVEVERLKKTIEDLQVNYADHIHMGVSGMTDLPFRKHPPGPKFGVEGEPNATSHQRTEEEGTKS